jgi:hypothetical protein
MDGPVGAAGVLGAELAAADGTAADGDVELPAAPVSEAVVDGLFDADATAMMTTSAPNATSPVSMPRRRLGRVVLTLRRRPRLPIRLLLTVWLLPWLWLPGILLADWALLLGPCPLLVRERVVLVRVPRLALPQMLTIAL